MDLFVATKGFSRACRSTLARSSLEVAAESRGRRPMQAPPQPPPWPPQYQYAQQMGHMGAPPYNTIVVQGPRRTGGRQRRQARAHRQAAERQAAAAGVGGVVPNGSPNEPPQQWTSPQAQPPHRRGRLTGLIGRLLRTRCARPWLRRQATACPPARAERRTGAWRPGWPRARAAAISQAMDLSAPVPALI